jgi:hypothetical protein
MGTKLHICEGLHVILLKEAQLSQNKLMQLFEEYGLVWCGKIAQMNTWNHLLNLLGENNNKGVQKPCLTGCW